MVPPRPLRPRPGGDGALARRGRPRSRPPWRPSPRADDVLELACGTGCGREHLARHADRVDAVDAAPEVLDVARRRARPVPGAGRGPPPGGRPLRLVTAAAATTSSCSPTGCPSPEERFAAFWRSSAPRSPRVARAFLVDSRRTTRVRRRLDHVQPGSGEDTVLRRLDDGRAVPQRQAVWEPMVRCAAELAGLGVAGRARGEATSSRFGAAAPGGCGQGDAAQPRGEA